MFFCDIARAVSRRSEKSTGSRSLLSAVGAAVKEVKEKSVRSWTPPLGQFWASQPSKHEVRQNYFDHLTPGCEAIRITTRSACIGHRVRQEAGYCSSCPVFENDSWGPGSYGSARSVVDRWMASKAGNRETILNPQLREITVGVAIGVPYTPCREIGNTDSACRGPGATYTADFGRR
jgi:hypothetical protein